MKILVVGGAGYIGSALVPYLMYHEHFVVVVDLFWFGDHLPEQSSQLSKIEGDAKNLQARDLQGFDVVIFLAGLSNDPMADFDPLCNFIENAAVPAYIAHLCGQAEVPRFIHGGSSSVYGRLPADVMAHETLEVQGNTPYGLSKHMAEVGCAMAAQHGVSVINFRMGTVCGYSPRMRLDLFVNTMVKDALTKGIITVNEPTSSRPILDIRDAVTAYELAATAPDVHGIINLISENATIGEVGGAVANGVMTRNHDFIDVKITGITDVRSYRCTGNVAVGLLGFIAQHHLPDTIEHVLSNWDKIENPLAREHYNIETFKALREQQAVA